MQYFAPFTLPAGKQTVKAMAVSKYVLFIGLAFEKKTFVSSIFINLIFASLSLKAWQVANLTIVTKLKFTQKTYAAFVQCLLGD